MRGEKRSDVVEMMKLRAGHISEKSDQGGSARQRSGKNVDENREPV